MMNLTKLYAMEAEGKVTFYDNQYNRADAHNRLLLEKAWLTGKIKVYEVNVADICITLENGMKVHGAEIK